MKKTVRSLFVLALAAIMLLGMVGCGLTAQDEKVDENTLAIQVESKGYGSKFARDLAEAYNAKNTGVLWILLKCFRYPSVLHNRLFSPSVYSNILRLFLIRLS